MRALAVFQRALPGFAAVLALVATGGCRVREYVVARDEVPLYANKSCDRVLDVLPLGHHEKVVDDEAGDGVAKVAFNGREGYVKREGVKILTYVHPQLDEGADRESTVGRAVRDVAVEHAGHDWPEETRDAIRDGRVLEGMSREQVELSWGWPRTIEPLASPVGGERWIYRRHGWESFDGGSLSNRRFRPNRPGEWSGTSSSSYYRMPVVEERVVEFTDRKVSRSFVRRYYDVDGSNDDES